ncbi:MAG: MBOAT family protein [Alphaproteobacteria bacterium]|nr:MBOAT family protein [Alphaproteobacteria bacterium]
MLFTAGIFWVFFCVVALALFLNSRTVKSLTFQNITLLAASYYFYGAWDWRFLGLIIFVTLTSYLSARVIHESTGIKRKTAMWFSVIASMGVLCFFKYMNFFSAELQHLLTALGVQASWPTLHILLPVGISFYTFQSLTYTLDVYFKKMPPSPHLLRYATYIAFFPQLVAGPIERARALLPQFDSVQNYTLENFVQGIRLIIFGLFLKAVIADHLAPLTDEIFASYETQKGSVLFLGMLYFAGQIYADFCGYSTIAIGVACIMGFRLMTNFETPYLAGSLREFWHRWHISLSTFFKDYVYIPLGGSRGGEAKTIRNLIVTFTLSGLWHGANWTFLFWGFMHGVALVLERVFAPVAAHIPRILKWVLGRVWMLAIVGIGWVFFRSVSFDDALHYLTLMPQNFTMPESLRAGVLYLFILFVLDIIWHKDVRLTKITLVPFCKNLNLTLEALLLNIMLVFVLFSLIAGGNNAFIYFQF